MRSCMSIGLLGRRPRALGERAPRGVSGIGVLIRGSGRRVVDSSTPCIGGFVVEGENDSVHRSGEGGSLPSPAGGRSGAAVSGSTRTAVP